MNKKLINEKIRVEIDKLNSIDRSTVIMKKEFVKSFALFHSFYSKNEELLTPENRKLIHLLALCFIKTENYLFNKFERAAVQASKKSRKAKGR